MSCGYYCSLPVPHGEVVWSEVYDYSISWSYSLNFYTITFTIRFFFLKISTIQCFFEDCVLQLKADE